MQLWHCHWHILGTDLQIHEFGCESGSPGTMFGHGLQGMKTIVTVNTWDLVKKHAAEAKSFGEVWVDYTDDQPPLRAKHPGDPRAALTPWLAHKVSLFSGLGCV